MVAGLHDKEMEIQFTRFASTQQRETDVAMLLRKTRQKK